MIEKVKCVTTSPPIRFLSTIHFFQLYVFLSVRLNKLFAFFNFSIIRCFQLFDCYQQFDLFNYSIFLTIRLFSSIPFFLLFDLFSTIRFVLTILLFQIPRPLRKNYTNRKKRKYHEPPLSCRNGATFEW